MRWPGSSGGCSDSSGSDARALSASRAAAAAAADAASAAISSRRSAYVAGASLQEQQVGKERQTSAMTPVFLSQCRLQSRDEATHFSRSAARRSEVAGGGSAAGAGARQTGHRQGRGASAATTARTQAPQKAWPQRSVAGSHSSLKQTAHCAC
jgi:hypothetical protein